MAHPLESSYRWRTPVVVASVGALVTASLVAESQVAGWLAVVLLLLALWLAFLGVVWLRTRSFMMHDGPMLKVRRFREFVQLDGRKVEQVRETSSPNGPCYRVRLTDDDRHYYVPAAMLQTGHSTFFDWLQTWAPDADLDKGCRKTIENLQTRGLIE